MRRILSAVVYTGLALGAITAALPATPALAAPEGIDSLVTGEMRKLQVLDAPKDLTNATWETPSGTASLADYRGKWVLLNFWAVWCAPCREEMPTLAALDAARGGDDFAVVTLATGPNNPLAIDKFMEEAQAADLPRYRDPKSVQARDAAALALPVTLIVNPEGQEVARLIGGADWNSPEAIAVFDAFAAGG